MKKANCVSCFKTDLDKDTIGINKKLLGLNVKEFYCMTCLADKGYNEADDLCR